MVCQVLRKLNIPCYILKKNLVGKILLKLRPDLIKAPIAKIIHLAGPGSKGIKKHSTGGRHNRKPGVLLFKPRSTSYPLG